MNFDSFLCNRGLIFLKALYGRPSLVHREYKKDLKAANHKGFQIYEGDPIIQLQVDRHSISELHLEEVFGEMLDIRIALQNLVTNSRIQINPSVIKSIAGIFNPCIDEEVKPHIYLK